ncbi:MAG: Ig-like domain repeat protein [Candidatus Devosia phytovorans]|uniref:Ig-like domain repeat protein n=1 Tax=Candidatus Devosia phytovorans TaxID=3121372 RepID=A0AAJ5VUK1_9HYPH|nr:Ig-like domain repeat protein [Devosia sp.]WEK03857.1 MAG: Ig-like domain repeat protein [Devosia sp.]
MQAGVRLIWRCTLSVMLGVLLVLMLASMALAASAGCNAVNSGLLNYTGKSQPIQTRTILLTNFFGGDRLNYSHTSSPVRSGNTLILSAGGLYLTQQTTNAPTHTMSGVVGSVLGLELLNLAVTAQSNDPQAGVLIAGLLGNPTDIVVTVTCTPGPSPTTLAVSSNGPTVLGQNTVLTATAAATDGLTPTGNVTFTVDGVAQSPVALNGSGVATLNVAGLTVGNHTVSASYSGAASFNPSSGTLAFGHTVNRAATTTTVSSSTASAPVGSPIILTAQVASVAPGTGIPQGSVVFSVDGFDRGTVALDANGRAQLTVNAAIPNTHVVNARYILSDNYLASNGNLPGGQLVVKAPTAIAVSKSPSTNTSFGQPVTFTATLTSGGGTPPGLVTFTIDGAAQLAVLNNGIASVTTSALAVGPHTVAVSYAGTGDLEAASATLDGGHTVGAIVTTTALTSNGPITFGQVATVTATVSGGTPSPNGSVVFTVDGVARAPVALDLTGKATLSLSGLTGGNHTISAEYLGVTNYAASTATLSGGLVVNKTTTATVMSPTSAVTVGQPLNLMAGVGAAGSLAPPDGTVVFTVGGVAQAPVTLVNGTANLLVPDLAVGTYAITAAYSGGDSYLPSSDTGSGTVNKAASTLVVNSSANPSVTGQGLTLTAIASGPAAAGAPTGTVVFTIDGVDSDPVNLSGGSASLAMSAKPVGTHTVTAAYSGNANLNPSSASLPGGQTVARAATSVSISSDTPAPALGATVTFTAQVAPVAPGSGTPTGNVVFSIDGVPQSPVALSGGSASLVRSNLGVGSHSITALYVGDVSYASSSGTLSGGTTVTAAATSTTLAFAPANPVYHDTATLTATVTSTGGTPAGTVIFTVNSVDRPAVPLVNGVATLPLVDLAVGSYTLGARYVATASYLASAATDRSMTVSAATTATTVSALPSSIRLGESTTISAAVTSSQGIPGGTVEFRADGNLLGTASLTAGAASLTTSALTRGSHAITVNYLGNANFAASTGALSGNLTVAPAATTLTASATPLPATFGQPVTLRAEASAISGTPSGSVIFTVGGVAQAPAALNASGVATLTVTGLEPGVTTVSASYAGDGDHAAASTILPGGVVVTRAATAIAVTTSPASPSFGQPITATATLTSTTGTPATGDVTFLVDGVARVPVTPTGGVASLNLGVLSAGSHTIVAQFAGDTHFSPVAGSTTVTLSAAATSMVLDATPDPARFGDAVMLTATLASDAGTPGGTVIFIVDGQAQAPATVNGAGVASLTTSALTVGTHSVTATYAANGNYLGTTATLNGGVEIDVATTQTALTASPGPYIVGDTVTLTANVTADHGTPNGTIIFTVDGLARPPIALVNGTATINQVLQTAGSHSVTATYSGGANFAPSSATLAQPISAGKASSDLQLTLAPNGEFGAILTVSAAATSSGGTPTGTVLFYVDGAQVGSGILAGGTATLVLPTIGAGTHTVSAAYGGDLNFSPDLTDPKSITISPAATTATVTATPSTAFVGQPITFAVSVRTTNGNAPVPGTATIDIGPATYPVALVNGTGSLSLSVIPAGTWPVTVNYAANGNYLGSTGTLAGGDITISPAPTAISVTPILPRAVSGMAYTGSFTAFGGTPNVLPPPYSYAVTLGSLPPGLNLDQSSGIVSGTLGAAGTYNWTVTATDSLNATGSVAAELTVLEPVTVILPPTLPSATFGVDFAQSVAASGGTSPYVYGVTMGSLPQGVALNPLNGDLTGSPTQLGSASFQITATDADGFAGAQAYTVVTIAPTVSVSGTFGDATVGAPYTGSVTVTGGAAPMGFTSDGSLPPGLSVDTSTGVLSGTPTTAGTYAFGIIATDANGFTGRFDASVDVDAQPMIVLPSTLATPRQNRPYSQALAAIGGTPPYAYEIASGSLPTGLSLNATTGRISGTPTAAGSFTFELRATDSAATPLVGLRSYTLEVQPAATLVVDTNIGAITAGTTVDKTISVSGGTGPYSTSVISATLPAGITFDPVTRKLTGTTLALGSYALVLEIADANGDSVTASVAIAVLAPPIIVTAAIDDHDFGEPATGLVAAIGGIAPYAYSAIGLPAGVTVNATTGVVSGTATQAGTFNATLTATDTNGFTGTAQVALTIAPPVLSLSSLPTDFMRGRPVSETITLLNGTTPVDFVLTGNLPDGLSFDTTTGELTGTPTMIGMRSFTITATDANGFTASATYTVEITSDIGTATLPASLPQVVAGETYSASVAATGGATPLTYALSGSLPAGITFNVTNGIFGGSTLLVDDYPIAVTVTGSDGRTNSRNYVLAVVAPTIAAAGTLDDAVAGAAYSDTVGLTGGKAPYQVALKAGSSLPDSLTISANGTISGTPTDAGSFSFVLTVTDANGFAVDVTYGMTIAAPTIALTANVPLGRIGQLYAGSITATGGAAPLGYAVTTGTLPTGLSLNVSTGAITGAPSAAGSSTVTITATDANGFTAAQTVELTIDTNVGNATLGVLDTPIYRQVYADSVAATGGTAPFTYALAAGALPTGLSLNTATGAVTGTPTATGDFSFTITATDNAGLINSRTYSLAIAEPELTISFTPQAGQEGEPYPPTSVSISGGRAPYQYELTDAPAGLTISTSGVISGTPTEQGSFNPTITVTDADGFRVSRRFALIVAAAPVTLDLPADVPDGIAGQFYSTSVVPSNAVGAVTYSAINLSLPPLGLSLNTTTGIISGTPIVPSFYNFTVRAVDSAGNVGERSYSMLVVAPLLNVPTTTTVTPAANSAVIGESLGVTVEVTANSGTNTPSGLVTLTDSQTGLPLATGALAADGTANFNIPFTTTGTRTLSAQFTSLLAFASSTGTSPPINVTAVPTTLTLSGPTGSVSALTPLVFVASVERNAPSNGPAGPGSIIFSVDGTDVLTAPSLLGSASYATLGLSAGEHTIRARYVSTTGIDLGSSDEIILNVTSPTLTTLSAPLGDILFGETATFTAAVTALNPGEPVSGNVIFRDNGNVVATVAVNNNGQAVHTLVSPAVGIHLVTAEYVGDQYHDGSAALGLSLNVLGLPPVQVVSTTVLLGSPTAPQVGEPFTLTATVTAAGGVVVPLGLVTFVNETTGVTLGTAPLVLGVATLSLVMTDDTATTFRADYPGDLLTLPSSDTLVVAPTGAETETELRVSATSVLPGETVELTANVRRLGGGFVNSGTIIFTADGVTFAQVPTNGGSTATVTSDPIAGSVEFRAEFVPDGGSADQGSVSSPQIVSAAKATPTLSANISILLDGSAVGRITVNPPNGISRAPTGTIDLVGGGLPMRTLTLVNGIANFSYPAGSFGPGSTTFTFDYSGDDWFTAASDSASIMATAQLPTQTSVSLSASQVRPTIPVTATINVTSSVVVNDGQVEILQNGVLLDTLDLINGEASFVLTDLDPGANAITAHYLGTQNYGQSYSGAANVTVAGAAPGALSVVLEADSMALFEAGQSITVSALIAANAGPADNISISSALSFNCPRTSLDEGETMTCSATYTVSEADMAAGGVDFFVLVSADGIADVSATLSLRSEADTISETFEDMGNTFVANRMRVLSSSIKLPNIFMRRSVLSGARAGTVMANADGSSQLLAFSTSLAEWRAYSAAQAADGLALSDPGSQEQLPFNIWLDTNYTIHASTDDDPSWGQIGTLAVGADYLITDDILAGVLIQGDWATEESDDGMVEGTGFLIGPYVSIALGENLSFDATILYGQSRNTATSNMFGDTFSGDFDTTRLLAMGELSGYFELDDLQVRPNIAFTLGNETIADYTVTNADGDSVSVPGGDQLQYRLTVGTEFEYEIMLDDGSRLTPSLGFDVGVAGGTQPDQPDNQTIVGGISVGVDYETEAGLLLGLEFSTELDSGGFSSASIRASIKGRF